MSHSEPKELIRVEKLIEEVKFKEALQFINDFKEIERFSPKEQISWHLLKSKCLNRLGQFEEALKFAENVYKKSLGLEDPLITLDILIEMAEALVYLGQLDKCSDLITKADVLLKKMIETSSKELKSREASISLVKGYIYFELGEINKFMEYAENSLKLQEDLKNKHEIARSIVLFELKSYFTGELDQRLEALNRCLTLEGEGFNFNIIRILWGFTTVYMFKGELDYALDYSKKSLAFSKEMNSKFGIAYSLDHVGNIYRLQGEFSKALEHFKQSKELFEDLGNVMFILQINSCLFELAIDMNDLAKAQLYLDRLKEYKDLNNFFNGIYRECKALLLKLSPRAINRGKAEEIFKQLVEEDDITHETKEIALVNLCDLLLIELENISDPKLLDEFQHYINQLLDITEKYHSHSLRAETNILQAKLALIKLDLNEARQFLTQAQKLAERYGLKRLAMKISIEHDELLKQLTIWENLKKSEASLTERLKLARLNEQMQNMIRKRAIENPELPDEEPVLILIISEGGRPLFSQTFVEDQVFEDHLFGGFFTAINSFINAKFSEGLDRAIFGEHTLLMNSVSPFLICYVFKGQSYSAQQRIKYFIDKIQNDEPVWQKFKKFHQVNKEVQLKDIPSLEPLIKALFIDKTIL